MPEQPTEEQLTAMHAAWMAGLKAEGTLVKPDDPVDITTEQFGALLAKHDIAVRLNVRSQRREWNRGSGWEQRTTTLDESIRDALNSLGVKFTLGVTEDGNPAAAKLTKLNFESVILALMHQNQIDPVLEWIESLPAWDKTERVENFLEELFGVAEDTDPEVAKWCARFMFVGIIERAKEPGISIQELPVLVAPQGVGKSTMLQYLLPEEMKMHNDFSFDWEESRRIEASLGYAIVEVTEMSGSTSYKVSVEDIKSWISRRFDTWRLAYKPEAETYPRRFIVVGTTNRTDSLPSDESGNRRFVPIDLLEPRKQYEELIQHMNDEREQLFAEALLMYNSGVRAALPEELKAAAAEQAEGHRHIYSDSIEDAVALLPPGEMSFSRIKDLLSPNLDENEIKKDAAISKALRQADWTRAKQGRPRLWSSPQAWGSDQFVSDLDYEIAEREGLAE